MKHSSLLRAALTGAAILITFGGTAACAAGHNEAPSLSVSYQDVDLGTSNGAQMLYKRIQGAALKVCGVRETRDPSQIRAQRACYANAVASAVTSINQPQLSAVHRERAHAPA